ncbi:glycerophosphodiester phosphodiesterase [Marinobacterium rhizophilum]|uniref:glycerophosphodiester phosphodiesterase n=1 Tax=Marinobacterium rhizophilum TaxID=420402 RepID=UPI00036C18D7|nr:glycerophosphodiester phosphodiesterase [Marinobacterium rhizophilum]
MKNGILGKVRIFVLTLLFVVTGAAADKGGAQRWTVDDVIGGPLPFAIGHRGYGENPWYSPEPDRPVENTTKAVREGFRDGIQIVEVDANLTADGIAVSMHDDFLPNFTTCVNTLTFEQLKGIVGDDNVKSLRNILQVSRTYSQITSDRPGGQLVVEIKTPSPYCVPLAQEPLYLENLVNAVLEDITFTAMESQVVIESFSPEILGMLAATESDVPGILAVDFLQLLSPEQVVGLDPTLSITEIDKSYTGFNLPWGEISVNLGEGLNFPLYRFPSYYEAGLPIDNIISTLVDTGSSIISLDKNILFLAPSLGIAADDLVALFHSYGIKVLVHTIQSSIEWGIAKQAGVDGIYIDNIPEGVLLETLQ